MTMSWYVHWAAILLNFIEREMLGVSSELTTRSKADIIYLSDFQVKN